MPRWIRQLSAHQIQIAGCVLTLVPVLIGLWVLGRLITFDGVGLRPGYQVEMADGQLTVQGVDPAAAGKVLKVGDRIIALAETPIHTLQELDLLAARGYPEGYPVTVLREGARKNIYLRLYRYKIYSLTTLLSMVFPVFAFSGIGFVLLWLRPDLFLARMAFLACWLTSLHTLMIATQFMWLAPWHRWEQHLLRSTQFVYPFHLFAAYYFFLTFPVPLVETRWLRYQRLTVFGFALVSQAVSIIPAIVIYWGPVVWLRPLLDILNLPFHRPFSVVADLSMFFAFFSLILRSYQTQESRDGRRRLQWVVAATGFTALSQLTLSWGAFQWDPSRAFSLNNLLLAFLPNSAVVIPISVAYTVLRYRVVGISVFLRLGMQYMLARSFVRILPLIPVGSLAVLLVQNPDESLSRLIRRGSVQWNLVFLASGYLLYRKSDAIERYLDGKFFRESRERDHILEHLLQSVKEAANSRQLARLLNTEIERAFHPTRIIVFLHEAQSGSYEASSSSGDASPALMQSLQQWLSSHDQLAEIAQLPSTGEQEEAVLVIPIRSVTQQQLGAIVLGAKRSEEPYFKEDKDALSAIAQQAGLILETLRLMDEVKQHERLQKEVLKPLLRDGSGLVLECSGCGRCYDNGTAACEACHGALEHTVPITRTILGRYRIDRVLGKGGMGAVYRARDLRLGRDAALKLILGRYMGNAAMQRRFAREAALLARLEHKNIVRIYDYGDLKQEGAFLVMEILEGSSLRANIPRLQANPAAAAPVLRGVVEGLAFAHSRGVIHRDLKPENCFLARNDTQQMEPKLLDFGLATLAEPWMGEQSRLTAAGAPLGTLGYMPPEQLAGHAIDDRADQFSLGVVCLEVLTGSLTQEETLSIVGLPEVLSRRFSELPESWRGVQTCLTYATALRREDRYASVEAFADEFFPALALAESIPVFKAQAAAANAETRSLGGCEKG